MRPDVSWQLQQQGVECAGSVCPKTLLACVLVEQLHDWVGVWQSGVLLESPSLYTNRPRLAYKQRHPRVLTVLHWIYFQICKFDFREGSRGIAEEICISRRLICRTPLQREIGWTMSASGWTSGGPAIHPYLTDDARGSLCAWKWLLCSIWTKFKKLLLKDGRKRLWCR